MKSVFLPAEFSVVGHEPVQASAGEDVVLPCRLNPPFDVSTLTVEWTRDGRIVHVYKDRKYDHPQDEQFRGRTSLFHEEMIRGNISLKLSNVTVEDSGLYFCYVPRLNSTVKRGNVNLTVHPQKNPAGSGGDNETEDDQKQTRVHTPAIVAISFVLIIAVSAVLRSYCRRRRTQGTSLENNQR
ncbi:uncharacterized protein V6R79_024561 [Siganus canaliculatus]